MLIEMIIFIVLGVIAGTITGLTPGIHINLINASIIALSSSVFIEPIYSIVLIVSMSVTHTFIDFIPAIFLGCPDTDTELSILPGHRLLKEKRGFEAIYLSNIGSMTAIIITIIIFLPSILLLKKYYIYISTFIPYILIILTFILILSEKNKKRSIMILLLAGILGIITNNIPVKNPLLPLLSGLFGTSNIILSIKNNTIIPSQIIRKPKINIKRPLISSIISAPLCSFLPSFGSGQAALIGNLIKKNSTEEFIVMLGIINTLVMTFSFISLYSIDKARTGTALAIQQILSNIGIEHIVLIIIVMILSGTISYFLTLTLSIFLSKKIDRIDYKKISLITIAIIIIVTIIISGILGIFILFISTMLGIYAIRLKVRRINLMGSLIIPTLIFLL